jgi:hypothetical protein
VKAIWMFLLKLSLLAENKVAITSSDVSHQFVVFVTTTAEKRAMVVYRNQWKMWLVYPVSATSVERLCGKLGSSYL